jgi:glucose/arabinose dehydrogenase
MVRWSKIFLMIALAGLLLVAGAYVGAQEKAPAQAPAPTAAPAQAPAAAPEKAPETGKIGQMAPPATAAAAKEPPYSKPYPMGFVTLTLKHVGAGVGMEWGKGVLTYKGKKYTFKVKGVQIGAVGISKVTAKGEVYNLFQLAEFPGQYGAVAAEAAVFKGKEAQEFSNSKGVHIVFKGTAKGLNLAFGPEGFTIRLDKAL